MGSARPEDVRSLWRSHSRRQAPAAHRQLDAVVGSSRTRRRSEKKARQGRSFSRPRHKSPIHRDASGIIGRSSTTTADDAAMGDLRMTEPPTAFIQTASIQRPRHIPSLDGLRALSVLLVIVLHTLLRHSLYKFIPFPLRLLGNGALGVFIFFVISGYLITTLLLREQDKTHRHQPEKFLPAARISHPATTVCVCTLPCRTRRDRCTRPG